ncbi:branched-chain-amino-acid transaminase [Arhodomonas sp. AD133]|uniref:branched-chain-amino-acid transaminase n=1 Tax=Arhodomonas sp. AD133 TaxID=3415009 RepID=UPI003EB826A7
MPNNDNSPQRLWLNGEMLAQSQAQIPVMTHSLHYGGAVFEGMRAYGGHIFRLEAHIQRLARSAELLGYTLPYPEAQLCAACDAVVGDNGLDDVYVRPIAWRSAHSLSVAPETMTTHVAIAAWQWPTAWSRGEAERGLRLALADWRRPDPATFPTASKTSGGYTIGTQAKARAASAGFDDALMLGYHGDVAETSSGNLFFVRDGALVTPTPDCFLDGITRREVIALAREAGREVSERRVALDELARFDEVFTTGSSLEVLPIVEAAGHRYPVGPVTRELMRAYQALVRAPEREPVSVSA